MKPDDIVERGQERRSLEGEGAQKALPATGLEGCPAADLSCPDGEVTSGLADLERQNEKLRNDLAVRTADLDACVRELECLFEIAKVLEPQEVPLSEILEAVAKSIASVFQEREKVYVCVQVAGLEAATQPFKQDGALWEEEIRLFGEPCGRLEVCRFDFGGDLHAVDAFPGRTNALLHTIVRRLAKVMERMRAEEELGKSRQMFQRIFAESPNSIQIFDSDGRLVEANRACLALFGLPDMESFRGCRLYEICDMPGYLKAGLSEGSPATYETVLDFEKIRCEKEVMTGRSGTAEVYVQITPLEGARDGAFSGYMVQMRDISDRKRAERQIRLLNHELLKAQEGERRMISMELHDRLGQDLTSLKIGWDTLFDGYPATPPAILEKAAEQSRLLQGVIAAVRDLSYELRPPMLDRLGLVRTVAEYCEDFSARTGLDVIFKAVGLEDLRLDPTKEINLYRIVQEALNNVRKHAEARHVRVRMVSSFPNLILRIEDDGKGFDVEARARAMTAEKRMGLRSIDSRVGLLEGRMALRSAPGKGTRVFIEVPLQEVG